MRRMQRLNSARWAPLVLAGGMSTVIFVGFVLSRSALPDSAPPHRCAPRGLDPSTRQLDLKSCGLTIVPAIDWCALQQLTLLDLSDNDLSSIPDGVACATSIQVLFLSRNRRMNMVPPLIRQLPRLKMFAQKSCRIARVEAADFPPTLQWLILTDNRLQKLPDLSGLGVRKLMLSHNRLTHVSELPKTLELLRISNNKLDALPGQFDTPAGLAWVAFSSNPFLQAAEQQAWSSVVVPELPLDQLESQATLATNQAKRVIKSTANGHPVAVKFFDGMDTDGLATNEVLVNGAVGTGHPDMINTIAIQTNGATAIAFELLRGWKPLGGRPNEQTVTRDSFGAAFPLFSTAEMLHVALIVSAAMQKLHQLNITHGDLYAHNVMVSTGGQLTRRWGVKLGDFGGASVVPADLLPRVRVWDLRAFGKLLQDMAEHSIRDSGDIRSKLRAISSDSVADAFGNFEAVHQKLQQLADRALGRSLGSWAHPKRSEIRRITRTDGLRLRFEEYSADGSELVHHDGFPAEVGAQEQTLMFDLSAQGGSSQAMAKVSGDTIRWMDEARYWKKRTNTIKI